MELYEKTGELGGVFVAAATPDFKDDDKRLLAWYKKQMENLGVGIHLNTKITEESLGQMQYDELFVATGATERKLEIPGLDESHVTYAIEAFRKGTVEGESILVVGGGLTGCEIAYQLARQGKKVTIIELADTILNVFGLAAANYNMLMELLDYYKVDVIKSASLVSYENGQAAVKVTVKNHPNVANRAKLMFAVGPEGIPSTVELPADHVVMSVGYRSDNSLYEAVKGDRVHLLGDAERPGNVMSAIWGAYEAAMAL